MDIRKISIGPDYKGSAMHYIVGQRVLGDTNEIHLIKFDVDILSTLPVFVVNNLLHSECFFVCGFTTTTKAV